MRHNRLLPLSLGLCLATSTGLHAAPEANPFEWQDLASGYQIADASQAKGKKKPQGAPKLKEKADKSKEAKCGEAKCGGNGKS